MSEKPTYEELEQRVKELEKCAIKYESVEEALWESERLLSDVFNSIQDGISVLNTDLTMPKMTGDKLVKEFLTIRPDIPIILCTGFSEKIDESKAKAIGAADYIEKPFDKRNFAFKIRRVLDEKR